MLGRYTMYRRRPPGAPPLPQGVRQDTRYATRHVLRPTRELVTAYLANPGDEAWESFRVSYRDLLQQRFQSDRQAFDALAALAEQSDVYLGCNCPTVKNPIPGRCHTYLALEFMRIHYPHLEIVT